MNDEVHRDNPMKKESGPKCGQPFDPSKDSVVECPRCHVEVSTRCCNPGGRNCICTQCEEAGDGSGR